MSDSSVQLNGNQTITFTKDENSEVAIAAFELGKRDIVPNVGESAINKLSKHNKLLTIRSDTGLYMYMNKDLSLDKKKNMFKNMGDKIEDLGHDMVSGIKSFSNSVEDTGEKMVKEVKKTRKKIFKK